MRSSICLLGLVVWSAGATSAEMPCRARAVAGQSPVCVCDDTYCDELHRDAPAQGSCVVYTSSEGGLRFSKSIQSLEQATNSTCCSTKLVLDPDTTYQTIEGFGGAVTDSAGINWKSLSPTLQDYLINSYYGDSGLQYNLVRVPIGGSDFSPRAYAYNELPENDTSLSNFSLAYEDNQYKIPMLKAIMRSSRAPVKVVATTWSPPPWMKTNRAFYGSSRLKPEYFQTYADYHYKFLQKYAAEGITVWAITTTNEPVNGVVPIVRFNSLGWSPNDMGKWIEENLGPTIRNSTFKDVKILAVDDQRYAIPFWFNAMLHDHPKALDYVDGVAVHYYGDFITPASFLTEVSRGYPGKFIIATEACEGMYPWDQQVVLGSWKRAKNYVLDIMQDLNHDVVGWIDWNLCLDERGGPNWADNFVDSAVIVSADKGEFVKQPMFYAMGHFAKFLPQGSRRIRVEEQKGFLAAAVENIAFLTPNGTIVAVLYNSGKSRKVLVRLGDQQVRLTLPASSVTTMELPYG